MTYTIRNARMDDLPRILEIYAYARAFMAQTGNPDQWGSHHPPRSQLIQDISEQTLFVAAQDNCVHGVFFFRIGNDPTYEHIYGGNWDSDSPYGTIHRIAGDGSGGILRSAVDFGLSQIPHIRIDTHADNRVMQKALEKLSFSQCGTIYIEDGSPRLAYALLSEE